MDIWSRLIGGNSPTKKREPAQRLARFKKSQNQLESLHRRHNSTSPPSPPQVLLALQDILTALQDEAQSSAPRHCAHQMAVAQSYVAVAHLAGTYADEGIICIALDILAILLDLEDENLTGTTAFADAIMAGTRTMLATALPVETETCVLEMLFSVAAKLRLEPGLLPTYFHPSKTKDKHDFALFYLILDYVHHDGKAGDFARTGLLYLIECAAHSSSLEHWIVESDLATLMASGLGALYSQLSRKLAFDFDAQPVVDMERTSSDAFQAHLATFLSYLIFWQDALEHCSSGEVKQTLLDHYKYLFLQQLLYPSLIESSDADGSSVAVLTYLRCMIESLDHPDLVSLTFEYLLAVPDDMTSVPTRLQTSLGPQRPNLFNLHDLVCGSLQSRHVQTVVATLRLVSTLLRHQHYRVPLVKTLDCAAKPSDPDQLIQLVERLGFHDELAGVYDSYAEDARTAVEGHVCTMQAFNEPYSSRAIDPDDVVLRLLLAQFTDFISNDIYINLALTQALSLLATCHRYTLHDWFYVSCFTVFESLIQQIDKIRKDVSAFDELLAQLRVETMSPNPPHTPPQQTSPPTTPRQSATHSPPASSPNASPSKAPLSFGSPPVASDSRPVTPSHQVIPRSSKSSLRSPPRDSLFTRLGLSPTKRQSSPSPSASPSSRKAAAAAIELALSKSHSSSTAASLKKPITIAITRGSPNECTKISLHQVLTNTLILQASLIELLATIRIRSVLFVN